MIDAVQASEHRRVSGADAGALRGAHRGDDLPAGPAHVRRGSRSRRSADGDLGAGVGRASAAERARAHLRRQHLLSRSATRSRIPRRCWCRACSPRRCTGSASQPILIYNLVFLSGFALSGVGVALLVRRLTGHTGAAILAGIVFAFPPYRIDHYAHLQLQQTQFIPLALWAFHRLLDTGRLRDGVLLGVCHRLPDAVVHVLRHLSHPVHGGRLRHAADRQRHAAEGAADGAGGGGGDRDGHDGAGGTRLSRGAQSRRRARPGRGRHEQRDLAELPGAAGGQRPLRQGVRALHGSRAPALSRIRRGRARDHRSRPAKAEAPEHPAPRAPREPARRPARVRARAAARLRRVARLQRRDLPRPLRLLSPVQGAAYPGPDGIDGRLFAGGAGRLRRQPGSRTGCHRRTVAAGGADADRPADARRVRVDTRSSCGRRRGSRRKPTPIWCATSAKAQPR